MSNPSTVSHRPSSRSATADVSVIGLGVMGSALAGALLRAGHRVTVFNRNPAKAHELVSRGAVLAPSAVAAIGAAELAIVCVSDYAATAEIFANVGSADLDGRTVVQLSSGSPHEARALASELAARHAHYLDGAILAVPRQIGQPDAGILVSAPHGPGHLL